jgi:AAA family ATP:ADP antiporter
VSGRTTSQAEVLDEGSAAWALAVIVASAAASLLCGYELLRSTANTLFVTAYGRHALPAIIALTIVGVTLVTYGYGRLLSRLGPRRTLHVSTVLAMATMLACYAAIRLDPVGSKPVTGLLYIFKESYIVLLIEQCWSFINSKLTRKAAKVLNGVICGIASIGAVSGGLLLRYLSERWGTLQMVPLAALGTLPALVLSEWMYRRYGEPRSVESTLPPGSERAAAVHKSHDADPLSIRLFRRERLLLLLILLVATKECMGSLVDLGFQYELKQQFADAADKQNAYSGTFFAWVNGIAMGFQLFLTPLLLTFVRTRWVHVSIPAIHLTLLANFAMRPTLVSASVALMAFKIIDYSVFRAAKELLYVPLSFDARYRAKELIDVLGNRASKGLTSLSITALQSLGVAFAAGSFALAGLVGAGAWLVLAFPLTASDRTESAPRPTPSPHAAPDAAP